jgi:RNA polymerase sigma factor (sigma-70 family)
MVHGVCRRILRNDHDAEDAFQATFLVLARKAASIARRELVANWLYAVAHQTAKKARAMSARRRMRERQVRAMSEPEAVQPDRWDGLLPLLDGELSGLPERYRIPIILCDLEGKTHREAAGLLGWPIGTVSGRLSRGRALLAERLARRERTLARESPAATFSRHATTASLPAALVSSTVEAASRFGAGQAAAGVISSEVVALAEATLRIVMLKKLTIFAMILMLGLGGGGLTTYLAMGSRPPEAGPAPARAVDRTPGPEVKAERDRTQAKTLLDRAIRDVDAVEDLEQRSWLLDEIARTQARAGLWDDLRVTQQRAIRAAHETEHSHRVIDAARCLAETGDLNAALDLANTLRQPTQRERALAEIASARAGGGDFDGAMQTASAISGSDNKGIALWEIAKARAERRDFEGALKIAQTIPVAGNQASALAAIAARQLRAKDPSFTRTLNQAREIAGGNHFVLAEVAGILAESGATPDAQQVARSIHDPTWRDIAWQNIAEAQARLGATRESWETTRQIQDGSHKGSALKEIVATLVRANEGSRAVEVADTISDEFWRGRALLEIAKGQARAGNRLAALKTFEQVLDGARNLKDNARAGSLQQGALAGLAKAQAEVGEEAAALAWIDQQTSPQIQAWSLLLLAQGIAERQPASRQPVGRHPMPAAAPRAQASNAARPRAKTPGRAIDSFRGKIVLMGSGDYESLTLFRIEVIHPDGTGLETVVTLNEEEYPVTGRVAPDGRRIALSLHRGRTDLAELWLVEAGGIRSKVLDNAVVAAWSPDGNRLACFRGQMGEWESFFVDLTTAQTQRLPISRADLVEDWSSDGATLAVMAGNPGKTFQHPTKGNYPLRQVYLMKPDGTARQDLTTGAMLDSIWARFSPDGKQLVYQQRRHQDGRVLHFAVVQNRDGSGTRDLVQFNELLKSNKEFRPHGHPCWSPDGTSVAWLVPRRKVQSGDTRMELIIISVPTGRVDRIDLHEKGIRWVQAIDWR